MGASAAVPALPERKRERGVMTLRRSASSAARSRKRSPEKWLGMLDHVVLLGSVAAGLSLAYLLFVILSGTLAAPLIQGTVLDQVTRNVSLAKTIFLWSLWLVLAALLARHYRSSVPGYLTLLAGVACWALLPLGVRSRVPETSAYPLMQLAQSLVTSFRISGGALIVLGFLRVVLGRIVLLASGGAAGARVLRLQPGAAEAAAARPCESPSLLRRCWELHLCREGLRRQCPRFLEGVSCWRKRSGCYCDQDLVTRILTGSGGGDTRMRVEEEMRVVRSPAWQYQEARERRKRQRAKKAQCGQCPLYLEHQKYKYRTLSWLSYPAGAALVAIAASNIRAGYEWVDFRLGSLLAQFQVLPHPLTDRPLEAAPWLNAENAVVVVIGVLAVAVILQLTELAVFRLKW